MAEEFDESETPSKAESVSNPVVLESPRSAVAVRPVPIVLLYDVLLLPFFAAASLELFVLFVLLPFSSAEYESDGIDTDGIVGEEISGIETEGILVCAVTDAAASAKIMHPAKVLWKLKVRKAFIDHFQS